MRREGRGWEAEDTVAREEAGSGVSGESGRGGLEGGQALGPGLWSPATPDPTDGTLWRDPQQMKPSLLSCTVLVPPR